MGGCMIKVDKYGEKKLAGVQQNAWSMPQRMPYRSSSYDNVANFSKSCGNVQQERDLWFVKSKLFNSYLSGHLNLLIMSMSDENGVQSMPK
eukprot:scaffold17759_cov47-Cyclotella_meneghiniana.AAC.1